MTNKEFYVLNNELTLYSEIFYPSITHTHMHTHHTHTTHAHTPPQIPIHKWHEDADKTGLTYLSNQNSHLSFNGKSTSVIHNSLTHPGNGLGGPSRTMAQYSQGWLMDGCLAYTIDSSKTLLLQFLSLDDEGLYVKQ